MELVKENIRKRGTRLWSVLRIRIREPVPFRTPGSGMGKKLDKGWTTRIIFPRAYKQFFGLKFAWKRKKGIISLVSHGSETAKIWSENEREISETRRKNRIETKIASPRKNLKRKWTLWWGSGSAIFLTPGSGIRDKYPGSATLFMVSHVNSQLT
jgi:hypothetical protein